MSPGDKMAGSAHKLGEQSRSSLQDYQRPNPGPAECMHEVLLGIGRHLNNATAALETIHGQLLAMDQQTKRRGVGSFTGYLLAVCVGVGGFLAWQSYGEAAKQIIATNAPELGWSPDAKQMIAGWVQELGWNKPPAIAESTAQSAAPDTQQVASAVQSVPQNAAPKAPVAPSIDPEQVHQIASDVAAQRQTIEQIAASQDQMARVVRSLSLCRDSGSLMSSLRCQVVATFENKCVAVAIDPAEQTPGFGWAVADTEKASKDNALSNCRATAGPTRGNACEITDNSCDGSAKIKSN